MRAITRISRAGKTRSRNNGRGFTLFELLIVMAVLTAASAVVMPRFAAGLQSVSIKSAVRDASDVFRRARALAILHREEWRVAVDGEEGSFVLTGPQDGEDAGQAESFSLPGKLSIQKVETFLSPPTTSPKAGDASSEIVFYPAGNCSGGWIEISDGKGRVFAIQINPFHGRVRVIEETVAKK